MKFKSKLFLGTIGTILLGALGSGFWELFLKKVIVTIGQSLLRLLTLIKSGIINEIYIEVANGNMNYLIANNYTFIAFITVLTSLTLTSVLLTGFINIIHFDKVITHIDKDYKEKITNKFSFLMDKLPGKNISLKIPPFVCIDLMLILCLSMFFISSYNMAKNSYVETAINQYKYLYKTITPYIDDISLKEIESKYVQVKNKVEYDRIIVELKSIANKNGINCKYFKTL